MKFTLVIEEGNWASKIFYIIKFWICFLLFRIKRKENFDDSITIYFNNYRRIQCFEYFEYGWDIYDVGKGVFKNWFYSRYIE
jgi:hypothetical protein